MVKRVLAPRRSYGPLAVVALLWLAAMANGQTTHYVDAANCPGPGDGTAGNPFCSIQVAIDASAGGDTVEVAAGTFLELINFNGKAITLQSTDPANAAVVATTIIDGNMLGTVVTCESGEGPATLIDGLTITGGLANFGGGIRSTNTAGPTIQRCRIINNSANMNGGGLYVVVSDPVVIDCTFEGNSAVDNGGGIYSINGAEPNLTGCTFLNNSATSGGGIYTASSTVFHAIVSDCSFTNNTADRGGAVFNEDANPEFSGCTFTMNNDSAMYNIDSSPIVTDCVFEDNFGDLGGGIFSLQEDAILISIMLAACRFVDNESLGDGGGVFLHNVDATISKCVFIGNVTSESGQGGGLSTTGGDVTIMTCSFFSNNAGGGGGLSHDSGAITVTNCQFSGNNADQTGLCFGGAIITSLNFPGDGFSATNCTFNGNWLREEGNLTFGAAIHASSNLGDLPRVTNCIFHEDMPGEMFGAANEVYGGGTIVSHSNIDGNFPGSVTDAGNNIDADPLFMDADGLDDIPGTEDDILRLQAGSPCIDAGDSTPPELGGITLDLGGEPRFDDDPDTADTGVPDLGGIVIDMGAYEFDRCPADSDDDGTVGITDFLAILAHWGDCIVPCAEDVDGDGIVGIVDFLGVLADWGTCP